MDKIPIDIKKWFGSLEQSIIDLYDKKIGLSDIKSLEDLLSNLLFYNFTIWQHEDQARRKDVSDSVIADVKRNIDINNQKRHNTMNDLDALLMEDIKKNAAINKDAALNSETPGSIFDRLMILALRDYHLQKELERKDASESHLLRCKNMLNEVKERSIDLLKCLDDLMNDYYSGRKCLKSYKEHKLYNDPELNPAVRKNP